MIDQSVTVAHPRWMRALVWLVLPVAGAGLGRLLVWAAGRVGELAWVPLRRLFELVAALPEPHATIGATAVGALLGLVVAGFVDAESLSVTVTRTDVTLSRPGTTRVVARAAVATAFPDGDRLVLLDAAGMELAREPSHLPAGRLAAAFAAHGIAFRDRDPYADAYRRWVPELPGLPPGADALFTARERALRADDARDAEELRAELARLGVVVRDDRKRQYWRSATPTAHPSHR